MKYFLFIIFLLGNLIVYSQKEDAHEYNSCSHLSLKNNGDTVNTAFCAKYHSKKYSFQTSYLENEPFALYIYHVDNGNNIQVAEFIYWEKEWERSYIHCKPVAYSDQLLRIYLKKKNKVQYDQIWVKEE